jgi:predicted dehydrogenase
MSKQTIRSRRQVLKYAAGATAGVALGPFFPGRVLGANDRVQVACVGLRGQGQAHFGNYGKMKDANVKYLCDVDENVLGIRLGDLAKKFGYQPGTAVDLRRVLDDKGVDAVSLAIPNHWHALVAIWAAQAGKHVYVEKPACHNVWEGRQMVAAARRHRVLMQVGFQNRSYANTHAAIDFLRRGKLGRVFMARGLCFKPRKNIGRFGDGPQKDGDTPPPMVSWPHP